MRLNKTESLHKELQSTRMRKDENDLKSLTEMLRSWGNPFYECIDSFVNLASDFAASIDVEKDLLQAEAKGMTALTDFVTLPLVNNEIGFYEPL